MSDATLPNRSVSESSFVQTAWLSPTLWLLVLWWCLLSTFEINIILLASVALIGLTTVRTGRLPLLGFKMYWPILLLCVIGLFGGLFETAYGEWEYLRDFVYLFKVPLIATATICAAGRTITAREVILSILIAAVLLSLYYIYLYIFVHSGATLSRRELRITVGRGFVLCAFALIIALVSVKIFPKNTLWTVLLRLVFAAIVAYAAYLSTSRTIPLVVFTILGALFLIWARIHIGLIMTAVLALVATLSVPPLYLGIGKFLLGFDNAVIDYLLFEMLSDDFGSIEKIQSSFRSYEAVQAWKLFETYSLGQQFLGRGFGTSINLGISVSLGVSDVSQEVISAVPITHIAAMTALVKCGWVGFFLFLLAPLTATYSRSVNNDQIIAALNHSANFVLAYVILTFQGYFSNLELLNVPVAIAALTFHYLTLSRKHS